MNQALTLSTVISKGCETHVDRLWALLKHVTMLLYFVVYYQ